MNRSVLLALLLTAGAILWVASGEFARSAREDAAAPPETQLPPAPAVRVVVSKAQALEDAIVVLGRTEPSREVVIRAETLGHVAEVLVEKGARVAEGDVIVKLAEESRRARLAEAQALLEQREIELNAATSLASKGYQTEIRAAEMRALAEEARALLSVIQIDLGRTVIKAPFDGVLDTRAAEVGSWMDVGAEVARLVDLDPILVVVNLTERDIDLVIAEGAGEARLVTGQDVAGRIRYVGRVADPATHTFRVELEVPNPDGRLAAGITADARLPLASVGAHRVSPAVLTLGDDGRVGVKTVDGEGRVAFVPVELLADGPDGLWISGLPETATIIVVGQEYVLDGQTVTTMVAE